MDLRYLAEDNFSPQVRYLGKRTRNLLADKKKCGQCPHNRQSFADAHNPTWPMTIMEDVFPLTLLISIGHSCLV